MVVHAIERLGRHLVPGGESLNDYQPALLDLVRRAELDIGDLDVRLFLLRQTRNDAAHQGFYARNAAREAVLVALRLEEALNVGWSDIELRHLMSAPITTQPGDTLGDVRRAMLEHAFTAIPARVNDRWCLISDRWLASELAGKTKEDRDALLRRKVIGLSADEVERLEVEPQADSTRIGALGAELMNHPLILVVESTKRDVLVGVVAPADLL